MCSSSQRTLVKNPHVPRPDACDAQGAALNLDVPSTQPADPGTPPGPVWVSESGCAATSIPPNSQTQGR